MSSFQALTIVVSKQRGQCDFTYMSIKQLNKGEADLDKVQNAELTLRRVHTEDKVEGRVVPVNQLVVGASDETVRRKTKCCFTGNFRSSFVL